MSTPTACQLLTDAEWDAKIARADELSSPCRLCPRRCLVSRDKGHTGHCRAPYPMRISSFFAHHGEEPAISGAGGSGTVFFSYCTLRCVFCQNYQLSHEGEGREYAVSELADGMLRLQDDGCHNVNLVTATHFLPHVVRALREAAARGLAIPVVYNCGGYESAETLEVLGGIVDVYLPDMKYGSNGPAGIYSGAADYVEVNRNAARAMFRQVGPLRVGADGAAYRGICIRHLVLPNGLAHSQEVARFLAATFDPDDITVSLMAQYRPLHRAREFAQIDRVVSEDEYERARQAFSRAGFSGYYQNVSELDDRFVIDFSRRKHEALGSPKPTSGGPGPV